MPRPDYPRAVRLGHLRPAGGRRRLHRAVDGIARRPAQSRSAHRARSRPTAIGWAASGRNGGFVDASLTHGLENGKSRWPNEIDTLEAMGLENLDGMQADIAATRPRRRMAAHRHAVGGHRTASGGLAAGGRRRRRGAVPRPGRRCAPRSHSPTYLAGLFSPDTCAIVHPAKLAFELARACREAGVAHLRAHQRHVDRTPAAVALRVTPAAAIITAGSAVLATNVFPSLLRRNRLHTVPVYDYVLATEPLTDAQLDRIGWREPAGNRRLRQPVSLLPADDGQPHRVGRLRRRLPLRPQGRRPPTRTGPPPIAGWPRTSSSPSRNSTTSGSATAGPGAIDTNTRFCAHWGLARDGRVAYVNGFTGLGVGAARFAADVCLDLLDGEPTARTELEMVRKRPLPFPPEPLASIGIQATQMVAGPRRPLGGPAQRPAAHARRAGARLRFLTVTDVCKTFRLADPNRRQPTRSVSSPRRVGKDVGRYGRMSPSERGIDVTDRLTKGEKLERGQSLTSRTGRTR